MDQEEQVTEVRTSESTDGTTKVQRESVATSRREESAVVAQRVVWYLAGIVITFLVLRVVLLLLAANQGNFFVDLVYGIGGFFAAPFTGIFGSPTFSQSYFDTAGLVAIVVYALIAWGIAKAFTLGGSREV